MKCNYCTGTCTKGGRQTNGNQKWNCKVCHKWQQATYRYNAYRPNTTKRIVGLLCEGVGIRSISRLLTISHTTVLKRILAAAQSIKKPIIPMRKNYEMDELKTYIGNKEREVWVAYAIRTDTREVVDISVGRRTNKTLLKVIDTLVLSHPRRIMTDNLKQYRYIIPEDIHVVKQFGINHIERKNLTLRTHLKRLARKTLCFSKSIRMLEACVRLSLWGNLKQSVTNPNGYHKETAIHYSDMC